jgi:hypothetical protein
MVLNLGEEKPTDASGRSARENCNRIWPRHFPGASDVSQHFDHPPPFLNPAMASISTPTAAAVVVEKQEYQLKPNL